MTAATSASADLGNQIASVIARGFEIYAARFAELMAAAGPSFVQRQWRRLSEDSAQLFDLYGQSIPDVLESVGKVLGQSLPDRAMWGQVRDAYLVEVGERPDVEIAETFFNSVTRKVFAIVGIDEEIEFARATHRNAKLPPMRKVRGSGMGLVSSVLVGAGLNTQWRNLNRDARLAAAELERFVQDQGRGESVRGAEVLDSIFYRGTGAYIVGTVTAGATSYPVAFCVHNTTRGLVLGALLIEDADISVLFSYTRSAFHIRTDSPGGLVRYLESIMHTKPRAELYSTIGHRHHAKTELYRDLAEHIATTDDQFERARGIKGMVMIVFTLPGFDVVFKVIRDKFPYPKQTTRRQIMSKYRMVFRRDRAGRMVDAHEYEQLKFDRSRFSDALIAELAGDATRTVTIDEDNVIFGHVYVERRVTPLDIYVREANPIKARSAIFDYGRAIKNLAATNVFPGDMLLKNFGVTRTGRVVFYDYDEITPLTRCKFRDLPDTTDPNDEMSATPWFGVGDGDVFPEEFDRFLGLREELRAVFDYYHSDLFRVRFWQRAQERVESGEVIEVFPYERTRRLGAEKQKRIAAYR